jgi:hypothetical protein
MNGSPRIARHLGDETFLWIWSQWAAGEDGLEDPLGRDVPQPMDQASRMGRTYASIDDCDTSIDHWSSPEVFGEPNVRSGEQTELAAMR